MQGVSGGEGKFKRATKKSAKKSLDFPSPIFFVARLDFPSPPLSAPVSPRMGNTGPTSTACAVHAAKNLGTI